VVTELGTFYRCEKCEELFVGKTRSLTNLWIAQRFYQSRGSVYTGQVRGLIGSISTGGVILLLVQAVYGKMPPLWVLPLLWLIQTVLETILGIKDYKKWKVAQNEGLFGIQFSPFSLEMLQRTKNIEKMVNPADYKEESIIDRVNGKC
jgi:hypothetical protein